MDFLLVAKLLASLLFYGHTLETTFCENQENPNLSHSILLKMAQYNQPLKIFETVFENANSIMNTIHCTAIILFRIKLSLQFHAFGILHDFRSVKHMISKV